MPTGESASPIVLQLQHDPFLQPRYIFDCNSLIALSDSFLSVLPPASSCPVARDSCRTVRCVTCASHRADSVDVVAASDPSLKGRHNFSSQYNVMKKKMDMASSTMRRHKWTDLTVVILLLSWHCLEHRECVSSGALWKPFIQKRNSLFSLHLVAFVCRLIALLV